MPLVGFSVTVKHLHTITLERMRDGDAIVYIEFAGEVNSNGRHRLDTTSMCLHPYSTPYEVAKRLEALAQSIRHKADRAR